MGRQTDLTVHMQKQYITVQYMDGQEERHGYKHTEELILYSIYRWTDTSHTGTKRMSKIEQDNAVWDKQQTHVQI